MDAPRTPSRICLAATRLRYVGELEAPPRARARAAHVAAKPLAGHERWQVRLVPRWRFQCECCHSRQPRVADRRRDAYDLGALFSAASPDVGTLPGEKERKRKLRPTLVEGGK